MAVSPDLRAVEEAYRGGMARLGVAIAYLSLKQWETVSPQNPTGTGGAWVDRTMRLIQAVRWQSKRLGISYYQLARAIETGATLGLPSFTDDPAAVSLDGLRTQMVDVLREIDMLGAGEVFTDNPDYNWLAAELRNADMDGKDENARSVRFADTDVERYIEEVLRNAGDDRAITVDRFTWPADLTQEQVDRAFKNLLTAESLKAQADKAAAILRQEELSAQNALRQLEREHKLSGSRGAGFADWAGIDAGRSIVDYASRSDYRVKGFCRQTGPNPCAFCAMLASRGWSYSSAKSAGYKQDADGSVSKYHPNCHCTVLTRWSNVTDLPPLSQFYQDSWPGVTASAKGSGKLRVWRQWLAKRGPNT